MPTIRAGAAVFRFVLTLVVLLSAGEAGALPHAQAIADPTTRVESADFLGGPFFGRHGYYFKPSERHLYYYGYKPHCGWRHHRHRCRR